ncbi:hypothetical protein L484_004221 [Morus notabilis]|uniref:Uncharacterized protein n=1 Tax=Morus notabilis TaxID=981085 RepID=W9R617_9ROSA|nr:hypothetical protein L484_004221 [Morus notabilis]
MEKELLNLFRKAKKAAAKETWKAHFIEELNNGKRDCLGSAKSNVKETTNKADDVHRKIISKLKVNRNENVSSKSPVKIRERLVAALLTVASTRGLRSG